MISFEIERYLHRGSLCTCLLVVIMRGGGKGERKGEKGEKAGKAIAVVVVVIAILNIKIIEGQTQRTNRPTSTPSYRNALTHEETILPS